MFIVATTLAMLAAVGVYAISAATADVQVSGYARQAAQASYIAEAMGNGTSAAIRTNKGAVFGALGTQSDQNCFSAIPYATLGVTNQQKGCYRYVFQPTAATPIDNLVESDGTDTTKGFGKRPIVLATDPLGVTGLNIEAYSEVTKPYEVHMPGYDQNFAFYRFTVTTTSIVTGPSSRTVAYGRGTTTHGPFPR